MSLHRYIRSSLSLLPLVLALAGCGGAEALRVRDAGADRSISSVVGGVDGDADPGGMPNGAPCAAPADCESGFCADGLCCDTACAGACMSCATPEQAGVCVPVAPGTDPRGGCADEGATSCGQDGTCDGAGACRKYPASTVCTPGSCIGGTLTFAALCDGGGACQATSSASCGAYACGADGRCRGSCATDADCAPGRACVSGSCGPKPPGAPCGSPSECASSLCQQGICCTTACAGTCQSCAVPGSEGRCSNVPAGQDPLGQCGDQGAASCGADGFCDGKGACRRYAVGSVCVQPACAIGRATPARTCDGAGTCRAATDAADCSPYACGTAGRCRTSCAAIADCASGFECIGGACRKRATGAACTAASQCATGLCQQGVCCSTTCAGTCRSCNLSGSTGTCAIVPAGQDPLEQCASVAISTCGNDGSCDGAGACRKIASGTICVPATCSMGTQTPARTCDGNGTCLPAASAPCGAFACGATACKTTCAAMADCAPGNACTNGTCGLKPPGTACGAGSECASTFCQQGVCCAAACTGTCRSCNVAGSAGTCAMVPAGQDPLEQCASVAISTCGNDGSCDGAGACRKIASGTICVAATCSMGTQTAARTCDGNGTCLAAASTPCGPFACGATACKTTCASDADCNAPNVCNVARGTCGPSAGPSGDAGGGG